MINLETMRNFLEFCTEETPIELVNSFSKILRGERCPHPFFEEEGGISRCLICGYEIFSQDSSFKIENSLTLFGITEKRILREICEGNVKALKFLKREQERKGCVSSVPCLSTGIMKLDSFLGGERSICPGYPKGYITVVCGQPLAGKTTLAIQSAMSVIFSGGSVSFFDLDFSLGKNYLRQLDLRKLGRSSLGEIRIFRPETIEETVGQTMKAIEERVDLIILDNVELPYPGTVSNGWEAQREISLYRGAWEKPIREIFDGISSSGSTILVFSGRCRVLSKEYSVGQTTRSWIQASCLKLFLERKKVNESSKENQEVEFLLDFSRYESSNLGGKFNLLITEKGFSPTEGVKGNRK